MNLNQVCAEPSVRITPHHVEILMAKRRRGEITERQMVQWGAHMVTANDAYFWEPEDADVAKWVNFLIFDFRPDG